MKFIIIDVLYIDGDYLVSSTKDKITLYKIPDRECYKDYNSDYINELGKKLSEGYSPIKLITTGEDIPDIVIVNISDNTLAKMKLLYGIYGDILEIDKLGLACFDLLYHDYLFEDERYKNIVNNIIMSDTYKKIQEIDNYIMRQGDYTEVDKGKEIDTLLNRIEEINCNYLYNETLKKFAIDFIKKNYEIGMTAEIKKYMSYSYDDWRTRIILPDKITSNMEHTIVRIIAITEFCREYFG